MALTIHDVAPDPVLTEIAMEYGTGGGFAHDQLMPTREVARDEFKYMLWTLRDFVQGTQWDARRAPGARSNRIVTPEGSWATGVVNERSLEDALPDEIKNNAPNGAIYERAIVKKLTNALRIAVEAEVRDLLTDTTAITYTTPTTKWDAASGHDIEADIDTAREAFILQCGFEPTHIVIPPVVSAVMKRDSNIRDLRKYTDSTLVVDGGLPPVLFGLRVVVPGGINDTANPAASASIARIWTADKCVLVYVDMTAGTDPNAMTAITRFASAASVGANYMARSWRDPIPSVQSTWYQVMAFDEVIRTADCAYILNDVLT